MWRAETRRTYDRKGLRYPTDLTDAEWDLARPFVDVAQSRSGQRRVDLREVLNAVFYILGTGCQWRALPKDLPPRGTVHDDFVRWQCDGCGAPEALDCRTHVRLVGALPPSGQRLRGAHALASRLCSIGHDPPHDPSHRKSFSNLMNSPDGLSTTRR